MTAQRQVPGCQQALQFLEAGSPSELGAGWLHTTADRVAAPFAAVERDTRRVRFSACTASVSGGEVPLAPSENKTR
jgi:hypothetical protein